jgi:hypothetical protein
LLTEDVSQPRTCSAQARHIPTQLMGHAMAIPFDAKERDAHFRDIPTTPAQIDAHLRRLDANHQPR